MLQTEMPMVSDPEMDLQYRLPSEVRYNLSPGQMKGLVFTSGSCRSRSGRKLDKLRGIA